MASLSLAEQLKLQKEKLQQNDAVNKRIQNMDDAMKAKISTSLAQQHLNQQIA
jgi:hypothetical protein